MTARDRLRETASNPMRAYLTVDGTGCEPLTYGDARKLDALVEAVGAMFDLEREDPPILETSTDDELDAWRDRHVRVEMALRAAYTALTTEAAP